MIKRVLKSKFLGALVGTGVGDALGAPFEGRYRVTPEEVEAIAEKREVLTYTDDTHMMIGVAESLIRTRGFDGEDMAHTFIQNYELEPFRGYGPGTTSHFPDDKGWRSLGYCCSRIISWRLLRERFSDENCSDRCFLS